MPATIDEDLSSKPTVQRQFLRIFNQTGQLSTRQMQRAYVNFYGNLMTSLVTQGHQWIEARRSSRG